MESSGVERTTALSSVESQVEEYTQIQPRPNTISSLLFRNEEYERITIALPMEFRTQRLKFAFRACLSLGFVLLFLKDPLPGFDWNYEFSEFILLAVLILLIFACGLLFLTGGLMCLWVVIKPWTLRINTDGFWNDSFVRAATVLPWNEVGRFWVNKMSTRAGHISVITHAISKELEQQYWKNWQLWIPRDWRAASLPDNFGMPHEALAEIMEVCRKHFRDKKSLAEPVDLLLSPKTFRILRRRNLSGDLWWTQLFQDFFSRCREMRNPPLPKVPAAAYVSKKSLKRRARKRK
jgi:hypothetical protein